MLATRWRGSNKTRASLSSGEYAEAKRNILKAYKRFGIKQEGKTLTKRFKGLTFRTNAKMTSIHVHHMSDKPVQCAGVEIDATLLADDGPQEPAKLVWIQLAKCGSFRGHRQDRSSLRRRSFRRLSRTFEPRRTSASRSTSSTRRSKTPRRRNPYRKAHPRKAGSLIWTTAEWPVFGACRMAPAAADLHQTGQVQVFQPRHPVRLKGSRIRPTHWRTDDEWRSDEQPFLDGMTALPHRIASREAR